MCIRDRLGPAIRGRLAARNDQQLATLIRAGLPGQGMPPSQVSDAEMEPLTRFLRGLEPRNLRRVVVREKVLTTDGKTLEGEILNQGFDDLQLLTGDNRVHLLRRAGDKFREVTSSTDWPGYNGDPGGNRYTTLSQITKANVARLGPRWMFTLPNAARLQVTPVVVGGIMYVSVANECYALDAGTGRQIWHYRRPPTPGLPSAAVGGTGGGEHGSRGFLAAYDQTTGKEVWRFWTVPKPGEPAAESWQGKGIEHPGAPTWFTGTYDAQLDTVYWPTGNPSAEYYGDDRLGDNLYSDCILALDAKTGKLKWHYPVSYTHLRAHETVLDLVCRL